jgi:segregation and condensation protein A
MTLPDSATSLPPVHWEQFDGPLDLLLEEVRCQNVAIEKVAMAPIVARFLEYVRTAADRSLNLDIEWLHMAARLIYWKSLSLLPQGASGEPWVDPSRDDLVQELLAHRKQAAQELARRQAVEETRLSRDVDGESQTAEAEETQSVSVWDLMQQARDIARWVREYRDDRRQWSETFDVEQDDVTVAGMIEYLQDQIAASGDAKLDGAALVQNQPSSLRRSYLFLGMLEVVLDKKLQIEQNEEFGAIWLNDPQREVT